MNVKKWVISSSIILFAILSAIYYFSENYVREVSLFKQTDFNTVNNKESWELFRSELSISKENSKIENFHLILDKKNTIYSIQFDLVDKDDDQYTIYHYSESKEENNINISKSKANEWLQYDNLVYADYFFSALDTLKQKGFFDSKKFEYKLIVSSGWNEEIELEGDHFVLTNNNIRKIGNEGSTTVSSGFNLQVIGSDRSSNFSTDILTTKSIFIENYLE
ncbi:hypothetical protein D1B31_01500 [Neobacillus notoginsengisoli]|uniref:Uncharacterized protein n=1 Tax=Neobacillus notoginsengisoli TaxID=1578198 RepID=A0A417YZR4_9BACI|nr:hypothetical protein [Neobacillus notoginsengisoli]RHW43367.1 hypothetical protein D1B31_01500 [Neobacillus notoginsengisoli]